MKDIEDYLSGIIQDMQDEIDLLEHQNKRYREVIEVAIHNMRDSDNLGVKFALGILEQVLAGDSDEKSKE